MAILIPPPEPSSASSEPVEMTQNLTPGRSEEILTQLADGLQPSAGEDNLRTLVRYLGMSLPATWVFLLEARDSESKVLRTVAGWGPEGFHEGFEVEPDGTVFDRFLDKELTVAMWVSNRTLVPQPLSPKLVRGLGVGLFDGQNTRLGSLAILSDQPIVLDSSLEAALKIYAAHAAAELDRARTVAALQREIQQRRIAEEDLNTSYRDLRDLAHHLQSIQEEERGRIAAQIHDELGQVLTALKIDIAWIRQSLVDPSWKIEERFTSIGELIDTTVRTVRHIATELRPRILDELGIISAIKWQLEDHERRSGLEFELLCEPPDFEVEADVATAAFRSFQELMVNILRHAQATSVKVLLERQPATLKLSVRDDGDGLQNIDFRSDNSFGLLQVQERAKYWGGSMRIDTALGVGTAIKLEFPLDSL